MHVYGFLRTIYLNHACSSSSSEISVNEISSHAMEAKKGILQVL